MAIPQTQIGEVMSRSKFPTKYPKILSDYPTHRSKPNAPEKSLGKATGNHSNYFSRVKLTWRNPNIIRVLLIMDLGNQDPAGKGAHQTVGPSRSSPHETPTI
uniref:Uncharacterized protein LOC114347141 n=1 Tax=Diabrotica virgifera virgifera TaxID=50390 RepID=A0A6P7GV99_DIAVI